MLGNFSFGLYGKRDAIHFAWEFITKVLNIPVDRLRVTIFRDDDEAFRIWRNEVGVSEDRIIRNGMEDNYWSMGFGPGPCGPCSEIFYKMDQPDSDGDEWLEIWNLVFMQHCRDDSGNLQTLTGKSLVDTGMGLERISSVLQSVSNNFEIDLFSPLFTHLRTQFISPSDSESLKLNKERAMKVIMDHLRASIFLLLEGVVPSNISRGYILRRMIRRAVRFGHFLGYKRPFLASLVPFLIEGILGKNEFNQRNYFPEFTEKNLEIVEALLTYEESLFFRTIDVGMEKLSEYVAKHKSYKETFDSELVYQLYQSYGFPVDLTENILRERGLKIDLEQVEKIKLKYKEKSMSSWAESDQTKSNFVNFPPPSFIRKWEEEEIRPRFIGYEELGFSAHTKSPSEVVAATPTFKDENSKYFQWISIDPCPFYATSGGQMADSGFLKVVKGDQVVSYSVLEVIKPYEKGIALLIQLEKENDVIEEGTMVIPTIDEGKRNLTRNNHTATHLLQAGLRAVLQSGGKMGHEIRQAGSLVNSEKLRFDFTFPRCLQEDEIEKVEFWVNQAIGADISLEISDGLSKQEAVQSGALFLVNENYGDKVRVVKVPQFSSELCGGTHVTRTSQILCFKILSEKSVSSGVRRIEAITGKAAIEWLQNQSKVSQQLSKMFSIPNNSVSILNKVESLVAELSGFQKNHNPTQSVVLQKPSSAAWTGKLLISNIHCSISVWEILCTAKGDPDNTVLPLLRKEADCIAENMSEDLCLLVCGKTVVMKKSPRCGQMNLGAGEVFKLICQSSQILQGGGSKDMCVGKLHPNVNFSDIHSWFQKQ
jgi:alanyl-tRNA synthetase